MDSVQLRPHVARRRRLPAIVITSWLDLAASEHASNLRPIRTAHSHVTAQPPLSLQREGKEYFLFRLLSDSRSRKGYVTRKRRRRRGGIMNGRVTVFISRRDGPVGERISFTHFNGWLWTFLAHVSPRLQRFLNT
jgi:hypothetical protein